MDDSYIKVKDLTTKSRFTSKTLKQLEYDIIEATNKSSTLEYSLFISIRTQIFNNISRIKATANLLSFIDVFCSLATVASKNHYTRPQLNTDGIIEIKNGRHPIVEMLNEEDFIGNDTHMNISNKLIHLITGPNMSGKSTYMRQVVLIVLMAQMGSFVPCDSANIFICDRIFTRIGASDNLSKGESTFMVEMNEVSQILNYATENSLVILDELGRGTSTYDGISLAWATVEYIQKNIKCHTLFATHYFELTELANKLENISNYTVEVEEKDGKISFLRKITSGCANKSYGIYVAELANLPKEVIVRAKSVLSDLEKEKKSEVSTPIIITKESKLEKELKDLDLLNMKPLDALNYLFQWQEKLKD